jgi:hypothetical protein
MNVFRHSTLIENCGYIIAYICEHGCMKHLWVKIVYTLKTCLCIITDNWFGLEAVFVECSVLDFAAILFWFMMKSINSVKVVFSFNIYSFLDMNAQFQNI